MENLNRSVKDWEWLKTDSGISTAERAKMLNHSKHCRKPISSLDAILRTMPHGSIAVTLKPSATDVVISMAPLNR